MYEELRPYATDEQWKRIEAIMRCGSNRAAAKALDLDEKSIRRTLKAVMRKAGGQEPIVLPDPKRVTKVSTLYDDENNVVQQWVQEKPEDKARDEAWHAAIDAMASELPRELPVPFLAAEFNEDLLAAYPVGDHHTGMHSWGAETGADYDLKISERLLTGATDYLMGTTPSCGIAIIPFLGDFFHYDSHRPVTPQHGNLLDADSRFPKMVAVGIRSMRYMIRAALKRHRRVHVIVEPGNHDPYSSIFLMQCLVNLYENEPRVTIDTSPAHFHYFRFGACLIGTHHGDTVKAEKLPLIMAADRPEEWGKTQYRVWWTGHVHHESRKDYAGCSVESFRILAPVDAHAAQSGYRSARDMKAILLHRDYGEVARHTVNPDMLGIR